MNKGVKVFTTISLVAAIVVGSLGYVRNEAYGSRVDSANEIRIFDESQLPYAKQYVIEQTSIWRNTRSLINVGDTWKQDISAKYDVVMEYLKDKYPSYTFHLTNAYWEGSNRSITYFDFYEVLTPEQKHTCRITYDSESETTVIEDTFFGQIKSGEISRAIKHWFDQEFDVHSIDTYVCGFFGEDLNEDTAGKDILSGHVFVPQETTVTVQVDDVNRLEQECNRAIEYVRNGAVLGSFNVFAIYEGKSGSALMSKSVSDSVDVR